jgi:hypothetical protein
MHSRMHGAKNPKTQLPQGAHSQRPLCQSPPWISLTGILYKRLLEPIVSSTPQLDNERDILMVEACCSRFSGCFEQVDYCEQRVREEK